jgi:hypothetical protein
MFSINLAPIFLGENVENTGRYFDGWISWLDDEKRVFHRLC